MGNLSFGIPTPDLELLETGFIPYVSSAGTKFNYERLVDPETKEPYYLISTDLPKCLDINDFEAARDLFNGIVKSVPLDTIQSIELAKGDQNFWRTLITVNLELKSILAGSSFNLKFENNHYGAHRKLEWRQDKGILRVKARDFGSIIAHSNKAISDIIEDL